MNKGIRVHQGIGVRSGSYTSMISFCTCNLCIRSNREVVVPVAPDGGIWITQGDGYRRVIADDSIRSTDPDPWSRIDPDNDGGINTGT